MRQTSPVGFRGFEVKLIAAIVIFAGGVVLELLHHPVGRQIILISTTYVLAHDRHGNA